MNDACIKNTVIFKISDTKLYLFQQQIGNIFYSVNTIFDSKTVEFAGEILDQVNDFKCYSSFNNA